MIPIIQLIVFTTFMWYITYHYGMLPSVSDSWYELTFAGKFLFTGVMWTLGVTTLLLYPYGWWFVASGVLLPLVGVAAAFREKHNAVDKLHVIGATGSIITVMLGLAFNHIYYPLVITLAFSVAAERLKLKNQTLWVEVVSLVMAVIGELELTGNLLKS